MGDCKEQLEGIQSGAAELGVGRGLEAGRWRNGSGGGVLLEGYVDGGLQGGDGYLNGAGVVRSKSLTDEDLEELKGCLDLGFGFNYEGIPELCSTLPALELCYSMNQRFLEEQQREKGGSLLGDHPEEVKARLKYWAQAVACTLHMCR
ncbi:unnamed protein product [Spirodela intermedia]|uniref:Uncharacterized protein n=1 Tax=Spirodela intermedia TaxID=51605 RepID=A0A7I8JDS3_SPIIN|nr:unnamed protein product [Spirodela intermedia]CAA6668298.1 unnamed protein product [Spirodela intermedia]